MGNSIPLNQKNLPEDCFVFKHSTRCPVSTHASKQVQATSFPLPLYWINVIEQRDLSNWIAEQYKIKHESPQLIRLQGGKVLKVWNHSEIKQDQLD